PDFIQERFEMSLHPLRRLPRRRKTPTRQIQPANYPLASFLAKSLTHRLHNVGHELPHERWLSFAVAHRLPGAEDVIDDFPSPRVIVLTGRQSLRKPIAEKCRS